jgi:primosomal protein N' (replication factor Y)
VSNSARKFYVQVAVPVPIRQIFDYTASQPIDPGTRVVVPFGRRTLPGVVVSNHNPSTELKLKSIKNVLDEEPSIDSNMLGLLNWASTYYHHPLGEVLQASLPGKLRAPRAAENPIVETRYRWSPNLDLESASKLLNRAPRQKALFEIIGDHEWVSIAQLKILTRGSAAGNVPGLLSSLMEKGLIESREQNPVLSHSGLKPFDERLSHEQQVAIDSVGSVLGTYNSFVLHGITGSGKTEVYLHVARSCVDRNCQVLILVPEIALTPQLVERFTERFGDGVCVMHSGMSDQQRFRSWWLARAGIATVILGTRSAIFTQLSNPGLIIIDEEHDISYKQQDGFRYHGRDLAIKRASLEGIPIILGSATPSMESMRNVDSGRHQLLTLSHRIGEAKLPDVDLIDLKIYPAQDGITPPLLAAINQGLQNRQQTILFINRRGYAPIAQCSNCAWQAKCNRCDAFLTYHRKSNTFRCHHCSKIVRGVSECPQCEQELFYAGIGTQRVENALTEKFPQARICRFDRDEITTQQQLESTLTLINNREVDIIIGTQLISKGHDFSGVTLVGILDPDQGLYSVDFRGPEYMFQQLVQVAGRAGRSSNPGRVMIQTAHPDNPYLQLIRDHDFDQFFKYCARERKTIRLPPYGHIALWRAESTHESAGLQFLEYVKNVSRDILMEKRLQGIAIMDPVSSPMEKRAGRYRAQLLIKADSRKSLHELIPLALKNIEQSRKSRKVRWSIDIDPMDMF